MTKRATFKSVHSNSEIIRLAVMLDPGTAKIATFRPTNSLRETTVWRMTKVPASVLQTGTKDLRAGGRRPEVAQKPKHRAA